MGYANQKRPEFPDWRVREVVNDLNRRFRYRPLKGKKRREPTWAVRFSNNRQKLYYRFGHYRREPGQRQSSKWTKKIREQRAKCIRLFDEIEAWRIREKRVLDKMNGTIGRLNSIGNRAHSSDRIRLESNQGKSLWGFSVQHQISLLKKSRALSQKRMSPSWTEKMRTECQWIQAKPQQDSLSHWSVSILYNLSKRRLYGYSRGWRSCIQRNRIKIRPWH